MVCPAVARAESPSQSYGLTAPFRARGPLGSWHVERWQAGAYRIPILGTGGSPRPAGGGVWAVVSVRLGFDSGFDLCGIRMKRNEGQTGGLKDHP